MHCSQVAHEDSLHLHTFHGATGLDRYLVATRTRGQTLSELETECDRISTIWHTSTGNKASLRRSKTKSYSEDMFLDTAACLGLGTFPQYYWDQSLRSLAKGPTCSVSFSISKRSDSVRKYRFIKLFPLRSLIHF